MKIKRVDIQVVDPAVAGAYFADQLGQPVRQEDGGVIVQIGRSVLHLIAGPATAGVHHLAFDIPIDQLTEHRVWLEGHTGLLQNTEGVIEFEASREWNARSLYYSGPDRMVLEVIGRREQTWSSELAGRKVPNLMSISEVGVAVPDVLATVGQFETGFATTTLGGASDQFAPIGDHDGLIIAVSPGRGWLPVFDVQAQPLPTRIWAEVAEPGVELELNEAATLTMV